VASTDKVLLAHRDCSDDVQSWAWCSGCCCIAPHTTRFRSNGDSVDCDEQRNGPWANLYRRYRSVDCIGVTQSPLMKPAGEPEGPAGLMSQGLVEDSFHKLLGGAVYGRAVNPAAAGRFDLGVLVEQPTEANQPRYQNIEVFSGEVAQLLCTRQPHGSPMMRRNRSSDQGRNLMLRPY
jgi:hypothetical protein